MSGSNAVEPYKSVLDTALLDDRVNNDETLWQVVSSGNLRDLTPRQKADYYNYRCRQSGLNAATQPYAYMVLNGVEQLYARKACADQLRKIHGVTVVSATCVRDDDYIEYEVTLRDREGREDFDIGVVAVGGMKGPERANKKKIALTQAKRRATLSLCGEGILDESEVSEIAGVVTHLPQTQPAPRVDVVEAQIRGLPIGDADAGNEIIDVETGEITGQQALPDDDAVNGVEMMTEEQKVRMTALRKALGYTPEELSKLAGQVTGITDSRALSTYKATQLIAKLESLASAEDIRVTA